ncbi:MAG: aminotransferase class V-fold PLP-dependent enzyme [Alphaproteobacteria bacterium]|nr:aminotransferase class V-fold PLP-dependent enzyme [Alphaproteobacteria bacterium]
MLECQRHMFDVPRDIAYFNCAAFSPFLLSVAEAGQRAVQQRVHTWKIHSADLADGADQARGLFGQLINAEQDAIAVIPATSYGIAVAAANLDLAAGQNIVVLEDQFPSNYYVWVEKAAAAGATLSVVPRPSNGDWTPGVLAAIGPDTAIAALPGCHWMDASLLDLEAVGVRCREVGAAFVIDATQSVGAQRLDVAKIQPDFLACSAYKWLLSPYSLAFLYAAPHRRAGRPLELHNGNHDPDQQRGTYSAALRSNAARYDMGERTNITLLPMACAAMEQLLAWGVGEIEDYLGQLTDRIADEAAKRGYTHPPREHRARHFIGLTPPGGVPDGLVELLAADNVFLAPRGPSIRISPHLHNDVEDIDRLFEALDRHVAA